MAHRRYRVRGRQRRQRVVEWPTVLLASAIYGGWLVLTYWHDRLSTLLLILAGAWLVAWHGSLQHETIHGHPTRWRAVNDVIGFIPLSLWLPYAVYRRDHVAHHTSAWITHPEQDPESRYLLTANGRWARVWRIQQTLVGRLLLGPLFAVAVLARDEARRLRQSRRAVRREWIPHLVAVALIVAWLEWTGFGVGAYVLLVVYPGTALTLLRSFAEHRADIATPNRAVTVEHGGPFAVLFLNNNFHVAHHERPDLAWYKLPAYQRHHRARLSGAGHVSYRDYGDIVRRFAFRPNHQLQHPSADTPA